MKQRKYHTESSFIFLGSKCCGYFILIYFSLIGKQATFVYVNQREPLMELKLTTDRYSPIMSHIPLPTAPPCP